MGIKLTQTAPDRPIQIYPDGKGDQHLAQYIARLIQQDIREREARERPGKPDSKLEKAVPVATVTAKDGSVRAVSKAAAIGELAKAADIWESRAREYGLDRDLKSHLLGKARAAKDEIDRLEGREVREPVTKATKPVTFSLPR